MRKAALALLAIFVILSCEKFGYGAEGDAIPIARVKEAYFYKADLDELMPPNLSSEDSLVLAQSFINSWAKKQLLLNQAILNLPTEANRFEKRVEEYRQSLYVNAYKQGYIDQNLDTVVSDEEIENFYYKNENNFSINDKLIQLIYIELPLDFEDDKEDWLALIKSDAEEDKYQLNESELVFKSYQLNDSAWFKESDVIGQLPILKNSLKNKTLKNTKILDLTDSLSLYLVRIHARRSEGDLAPLSYIKPTVKRIILQQRKLDLLRAMEEILIDEAVNDGVFETYND